MSTPINLNKARKQKARTARRQKGDENAQRFGRTKAQKQAQDTARASAARHLDGHKTES